MISISIDYSKLQSKKDHFARKDTGGMTAGSGSEQE